MAQQRITLLGSAGGVAKALLSLLDKAARNPEDPLYPMLSKAKLHLVDKHQKPADYYRLRYPNVADKADLHQLDLADLKQFRKLLKRTKTTLVIDVSWADTAEMLECCNELGIGYINSALENSAVDANDSLYGFTLMERYHDFEKKRGEYSSMKAIVCSGMNPGVVQWMAKELMSRYPAETPTACYIVEHDTSFYADPTRIEPQTIYSTWSPECFLDEAIMNYPLFVRHRTPLVMYDDVYALEFQVTLGSKQFKGCLMPHEEVLTLGKQMDMETGFIYRVNEYTTKTIISQLDQVDDLWEWKHKVLDPDEAVIEGEDLVGVLLVYGDKERYMYNVMGNREIFADYGTNATYLQVACGLYAAMATMLLHPDLIPYGIHYVDELSKEALAMYGRYAGQYMKHFVAGENPATDGYLLQRKSEI